MRADADVDVDNAFRLLDALGQPIPYVRWADTETGEYAALRYPWGGEIVTCGIPFSVVRWPAGDFVADYAGTGMQPTRRMRMHVEDDLCDDHLRVFDLAGNRVGGVRWFDTEAEQVGKLPTDERGCVLVPADMAEPWPPPDEVLNIPFRVVDSRDGSVVISSRSLQ